MTDFEQQLRAAGLRPLTAVLPDGRWHRCPTDDHPKKKNGAWKLTPDGRIGWFWNLAVHAEPITWRPDKIAPATPLDMAAIARRTAQERRERQEATEGARRFYAACKPLVGGHPYLESHGLDMAGCYGLKVDRKGWLVIPAHRGRDLLTVQRISPEGEKRFWPGAPVQAASYTVERAHASIMVLCEGLATGLAIFAAAPLTRVVVAFNSGNLARVAVGLQRRGMACVAADNDHETAERLGHNPGLLAAEEAAHVLGCGVAAPEGIAGTDWADYRAERLATRLAARPHGSRERDTDVRRAVDAEIAAAISRAARFLRRSESA